MCTDYTWHSNTAAPALRKKRKLYFVNSLCFLVSMFLHSAFVDLLASSDSGSSSGEEGSECWQMQHAIAQSLQEEK